MTTCFSTRTFTAEDVQPVNELQQQYAAVYPQKTPVPAQMYDSPYFENGRNVLVACDETGRCIAYAPYFPQNELAWVEIEALPGLENTAGVKDALFDWLISRARAGGVQQLNFQYFPGEVEAIGYAQAKGASYRYSIFTMQRPLDRPIPEASLPGGFHLRRWRMESEAEQRRYLDARNECFPEAPTTLAEWQFFAGSPHWQQGVNVAAFSGETLASRTLAASVLVFWEPGSPTGATEYIFTRPPYRGQGLARALIAEALRYLKEHGLQKAALDVRAENPSALSVYRGMGYEVTAESRVYGKRT